MHMLRLARPVIYPLALLVGSLFVVAAALAHPDLTGDGAAQLSVIARSEAWRAIHWAFLFGFALALTGLVGVMGMHVGTPGEAAARAGVLVASFAYGAGAVAGGMRAAGRALAFAARRTAGEAAFVLPVLWRVVTGGAWLRRPWRSAGPQPDDPARTAVGRRVAGASHDPQGDDVARLPL